MGPRFITSVKAAWVVAAMLWPMHTRAQDVPFNATPTEINAFITADLDRNRVLNPAEFESFVRLMAEAGRPMARRIRMFGAYRFAFNIADANDDGIVTPAELRATDDVK